MLAIFNSLNAHYKTCPFSTDFDDTCIKILHRALSDNTYLS